jgi:hypothetical protein
LEEVVTLTLETLPHNATHWSRASMAARSGLSKSTTNWNIARNALVAIQDAEDVEEAQYAGRTHALTAMIFMLSQECAAWADTFGSHLGDAYRRITRVDDARADLAIEALMNRAWEKRQMPLR